MRPRVRGAPAWRSAISAISSRSRGPRRMPQHRSTPDYWTVFNEEKASEAAAAAKKRGLQAGFAGPHPGRGRPLLSRPRGRLRGRRRRRGRRPPRRDWTARLRRHHHLPGAPLRSGDAEDRADAKPCDARHAPPKLLRAAAGGTIEINAPGTTSSARARGLGGSGRDAGRAGPRPDRHDPAACGRRSARAAGGRLCERGVPPPRRRGLLLRRRALHRSGFPRLRGQGDRVARADRAAAGAPHTSRSRLLQPSTITA